MSLPLFPSCTNHYNEISTFQLCISIFAIPLTVGARAKTAAEHKKDIYIKHLPSDVIHSKFKTMILVMPLPLVTFSCSSCDFGTNSKALWSWKWDSLNIWIATVMPSLKWNIVDYNGPPNGGKSRCVNLWHNRVTPARCCIHRAFQLNFRDEAVTSVSRRRHDFMTKVFPINI